MSEQEDREFNQYLSKLSKNDFYTAGASDGEWLGEYDFLGQPDPLILEHLSVYNWILQKYKQDGPQAFLDLLQQAVKERILNENQSDAVWAMMVRMARTP